VLERLFYGSRVGLWLEFRGLKLYWEGPDPGLKEGQTTGLTIRLEHLLALEKEPAPRP
jgi:putative spermidine/putrescine transport system ATP-binding protein